ncbi:hypothetical protein [Oceanobacillus rekensis]|uniref:hypothetical protein n=1 Tax=Oceanobacillus rekensis TaxID=937927 RepID=UPI000B45439E|nr:hypothetical protein [Oceanobacillus rekensis]
MSNRIWFEDAGKKMDPKLVEQFRINGKDNPNETSQNEIPVIVLLKKNCEKDAKDDLLKTCNLNSRNKLENELRSINGLKGLLNRSKIMK